MAFIVIGSNINIGGPIYDEGPPEGMVKSLADIRRNTAKEPVTVDETKVEEPVLEKYTIVQEGELIKKYNSKSDYLNDVIFFKS